MEQFIYKLGSMSIQAIVVILVVLLVRAVFSGVRAPKKYVTWLWLVPYVIMICPWKISSVFSFWRMPKQYQAERIQAGAEQVQQTLTQMAGSEAMGNVTNDMVNQVLGNVAFEGEVLNNASGIAGMAGGEAIGNVTNSVVSGQPVFSLMSIVGLVWLLGVAVILLYSVVSYVRLQKKVLCSVKVQDNIYRADDISTAFVLGVIRPKIYIPSALHGENLTYVLEHEKTHIKQWDPLKKILAYTITTIHWFNPFAWVAFNFFCKDMEMACDEETIARIGMEKKQEYAMALLQLSSARKMITGAPLAFGEDNVKDRVRNIAKFKKAWVFVSVVAVIVVIVLAAGFLSKNEDTTTLKKLEDEVGVISWSEDAEPIWLTIGEERTFFSEAHYDSFVEFFNQLEVTKEPISPSRAEDRPKDVVLRVGTSHYNIYNGTYIYIGNDYKEIWFDDGLKSSLSYGIINPQQVIDFIKLQEGSVAKAEEQEPSGTPEPEVGADPEGDVANKQEISGNTEEIKGSSEESAEENPDEWSQTYPWADLDGDGTEEYILVERGDFQGLNSVNGRLTVFVNDEPVYQYTEELWIVGVDSMEYLDLDGDGQEEIFVSFMPAVNSMPLEEWFVLKKVGDSWERLEMYHYQDDMLDNSFPITVVLKEKEFDFVIRCEGWEGEIAFDATEHYERRKAEQDEGNGAYEAFMEGPYVAGSVVGSPLAWGVWHIQTGTYEGNNCLIAEHGLGGPWGKYDYYGNAYVYFNYDENGKIRILHMEFVPTDF